jgi:hypothetical protein
MSNTDRRSAHLLTEPWLRRIMDASRAPSCYAVPQEGESTELHVARAIAAALTYDDRELRALGLTPALPSEHLYAERPVRLREGALSPLATPTRPPAKPHLTPLEDDGIELEPETQLADAAGAPIAGEPVGGDPWRMPALEHHSPIPAKPPIWNADDIVYHNRPLWADLSVLTIATAIIASIAFALALVAVMYG